MGKSKFSIRLKVFKQRQDDHQEGVEIRAGRGGCQNLFLD